MNLTRYIELRLGRTPGDQARNFLGKPLGADSLAGFWRYWNPVWSYYLGYYCYKPLRSYLPRWAAAWATFVFCGLAHDLPFVAAAYASGAPHLHFTLTVFFAIVGALTVGGEGLRLRFTRLPRPARWVVHLGVLFACYGTALYITS
jgi:hypothetical protein